MAIWNRRASQVDRISSEALADFGRYEFLGSEQSGITDAYSLVSNLVSLSYPPDGPGAAEIITELRKHSQSGEWEKVGAWKFVREFFSDVNEATDLIDGGLLAIYRMRVTNLAFHLAPVDLPRYVALTGGPPSNDGFAGPPVFDSAFGPSRQYYFDHAVSSAAARQIHRLAFIAGVEPGAVEDAARAMWDFGILIYRGPLVVSPDTRFEPNVVKPAVNAATGVDHQIFANRLVDVVLKFDSRHYGPWAAIGAARFIEYYLDSAVADSEACRKAIDSGLTLLLEMGIIGGGMTPELLTPRQRERLLAIRS